MHYRDLSPYIYAGNEPDESRVNIGWLSCSKPYTKGRFPIGLLPVLKTLVDNPVNEYRGKHYCGFCPQLESEIHSSGFKVVKPIPVLSGNGEIHLQGSAGVVYIAPVLVYHYIKEHQYMPPAEFIEALEYQKNA